MPCDKCSCRMAIFGHGIGIISIVICLNLKSCLFIRRVEKRFHRRYCTPEMMPHADINLLQLELNDLGKNILTICLFVALTLFVAKLCVEWTVSL